MNLETLKNQEKLTVREGLFVKANDEQFYNEYLRVFGEIDLSNPLAMEWIPEGYLNYYEKVENEQGELVDVKEFKL